MSQTGNGPLALHIVSVAVEPVDPLQGDLLGHTASDALFQAAYNAARPKLDWIARLPAGRRASRLAVIMPDSTDSQAAAVTQSIRNAFAQGARVGRYEVKLSSGNAQFTADRTGITALELLNEAERNRREPGSVAASAAKTAPGPGETLADPAAA
jgi:hypothetical protein